MTTMKPCLKNRQLCIASELLYAIILLHSLLTRPWVQTIGWSDDNGRWIRGSDHWGGAIELSVLSDHFSTMICAWNIQSVRPDRFGEGKGDLKARPLPLQLDVRI